MLSNFTIKNYKNIKEMSLDNLRRFNLFIGYNNTGKSNIMEAVALYASHISAKRIAQILKFRNEDITYFTTQGNLLGDQESSINTFLPLVHNRDLQVLQDEGIILGPKGAKTSLQLKRRITYLSAKQRNSTTTIVEFNKPLDINNAVIVDMEPVLATSDLNMKNAPGHWMATDVQKYRATIMPKETPIIPYNVVNCMKRDDVDLGSLWTHISMTPLEQTVLEALQIIEPNITQFNLLKKGSSDNVPFVNIGSERIQLYSMGEGISRILNIILALVNSKDGILILDEEESGLHYLLQSRLWDMLVAKSNELNVQIFATTHSNDCIKAFAEKTGTDGAVWRLEKADNQVTIDAFPDMNQVLSQLAAGVDIRAPKHTDDLYNDY